MTGFIIRFFLCNLAITGIIGIFLMARRIFVPSLSPHMQYNLWFPLFGLLTVPFLPLPAMGFSQIFLWFEGMKNSLSHTGAAGEKTVAATSAGNTNWVNDFALSVNSETPQTVGYILLGIWIAGILGISLFLIKSSLGLRTLEKSALPLENPEVRRLYKQCLHESGITKNIPVYSTAFLKSPIIVGFLKPRIYLPLPLISDYRESDFRYMLLHELQHYRHRDALALYLLNFAVAIYWFNPLVWYACKEMRNDMEIACDTSVLKLLETDSYEDYGYTLINFAEKVSLFPFATGLGGSRKLITRRIGNIASYEKPSFGKTLKGICSCFLITCLLLAFAPILSVNAADKSTYSIDKNSNTISYLDLSSYFMDYQGCFVLYDDFSQNWQIYNQKAAQKRISPYSTYKIYSALLALENGTITPASNHMAWNGQEYPIPEWNEDQNLTSAFQNSVNWYFQSLDQAAGRKALEDFYTIIDYGNHDLSGDISSFWSKSSLKISPLEQVEMLRRLFANDFDFEEENIQTVKNSLYLSSSAKGNLYGKTGTGNRNGENINGWFVGWVETSDNTYYFALNMEADKDASGIKASEIALSILSDLHIF